MRPTPYVASLRVYEPIEAFDPVDRVRWKQIPMNIHTGNDEQKLALRRVIRPEPPFAQKDGAHILEHDGERFVAPWSTAIRTWAALADFKTMLPSSVFPLFLPQNVEEAISAGSEDWQPTAPHILTETWAIPPRWFSLFVPEERLRGDSPDGPFTIMRTKMEHARERIAVTYAAVLKAFGDGEVSDEVKDLLEWLDLFHPRSIVELDYGGLAGFLVQLDGSLDLDTSVEDVHASIQGLIAGDGVAAGRGYERLVSRWRRIAAFEYAT